MEVHKKISNLYSIWEKSNIKSHSFFICAYAVCVMSILLPFDLFLFDDNKFFINRIVIISFLLLLLSVHKFYENRSNSKNMHKALLFSASNFITTYYLYYFLISSHDELGIVFFGNILTILFTNFMIYKYWLIQYSYLLVQFASITVISFLLHKSDVNSSYIALLLITHICSGIMSFINRRLFFRSLYERYLSLQGIIPPQVAEHIVTSDVKLSLSEAFPLKERFVCCLSSDWRGYQKLAKTLSLEELNDLQENFYETVFSHLFTSIPNKNYFINWTADELFIVFYSINDDDNEVLSSALKFAEDLVSKVYDEILSRKLNINYDVGLAAGNGFLGVQGPSFMKKTTVTGEVAGRAKRLESQGKEIRKELNLSSDLRPSLIMDEKTYFLMFNINKYLNYTKSTATVKDIVGGKIYISQTNNLHQKSA